MVVAHGGLISVALSELCDELTLEEMLARHIGNAEVVRARFERDRLVCYDWDGEPIPSRPGAVGPGTIGQGIIGDGARDGLAR